MMCHITNCDHHPVLYTRTAYKRNNGVRAKTQDKADLRGTGCQKSQCLFIRQMYSPDIYSNIYKGQHWCAVLNHNCNASP